MEVSSKQQQTMRRNVAHKPFPLSKHLEYTQRISIHPSLSTTGFEEIHSPRESQAAGVIRAYYTACISQISLKPAHQREPAQIYRKLLLLLRCSDLIFQTDLETEIRQHTQSTNPSKGQDRPTTHYTSTAISDGMMRDQDHKQPGDFIF